MSDTFSVRITATETASPAFRSIAAEAKKADTVLDSLGDGALKALQAIERNTAEAAASIKEFGNATQEAETKTKGFGDSLTKIGAGAGTALSALALLGQAAVSQQNSIASLQRSYGSASDEILAFTERIQDSTRFSNDSARDAASLAATLANQYGLSTSQIEQLLTRTADLAQQFGISFEDAAMRTTSAIRGEAESAEILNLSLSQTNVAAYAASLGFDNYNTTMSASQQAQIRLALLLEQSANSQGAAGEAAQTAAGQAQQFVNSLQDGAAALGGFLGPAAQMASVLAPTVLALPLVGAGLGQMATAAKTAGVALAGLRIGSLAIGAALGPIGIAAAAIAGGIALYEYANRTTEMEKAQASAATAVENLTVLIRNQAAAGIDTGWIQEQTTALADLTLQRERADTAAAASRQRFNDIGNTEPGRIPELQAQFDGLTSAIDRYTLSGTQLGQVTDNTNEILRYQGENVDNVRTQFEEARYEYQSGRIDADAYAARLVYLSDNLDNVGISAADVAAAQTALNSQFSEGSSLLDTYSAAYTRYFDSQKPQGQSQVDVIEDEIEASGRRARQYQDDGNDEALAEERRLQRLLQNQLATAKAAEVEKSLSAAITSGIAGVIAGYGEAADAQLKFTRQGIDEFDAYLQKQQEIEDARRDSINSVKESYQSALGQNSFDAPFLDGLDAMVAVGDISQEAADAIKVAFDQLAASGASALEVTIALADSMGYAGTEALGFASGLANAVAATDGVLGLFDAIDSLGGVLEKANGVANDLFGEGGDAFDGVGPLVDLLNSGKISQEEFNAAVQAGVDIQADNIRGQEALNEVRAKQLPYLAEQTENLANYYELLANLDPLEAQRALYLQDAGNQQQLLNIQQLVYANSIGQLPDNVTTDLLLNSARADPVLAKILEDMGLIEIGANGEITVTLPDGEETVTTLTDINDTLLQLNDTLLALLGIDPFDPLIEKGNILAGIDFSNVRDLGSGNGIGGLVGKFGNGPGSGRPGDGIDGYNPLLPGRVTEGGDHQPNPNPPGAFPAVVPGASPIPPAIGTRGRVGIGFDAGLSGSLVPIGRGNTAPPGAFPATPALPAPYGPNNLPPNIPATPPPAQGGTANTVISLRTVLDDGATPGLERLGSLTSDLDGRQALLDALANDEASPKLNDVRDLFGNLDGTSATPLAKGDNASALAAATDSDSAFAGIDGVAALLFANGDSSSAEAAASAGAGAINGMDGTTGYVYAEGVDRYSGTINSAKSYNGALLSTSYIDVITRYKSESIGAFFAGKANGGVLGYADGGVLPTAALGRVLVGENGPEIATLPGGTLITPSPASQAIARTMRGEGGGSGPVVFNNYGTINGIEDLADFLGRAMALSYRQSSNAFAGAGVS